MTGIVENIYRIHTPLMFGSWLVHGWFMPWFAMGFTSLQCTFTLHTPIRPWCPRLNAGIHQSSLAQGLARVVAAAAAACVVVVVAGFFLLTL